MLPRCSITEKKKIEKEIKSAQELLTEWKKLIQNKLITAQAEKNPTVHPSLWEIVTPNILTKSKHQLFFNIESSRKWCAKKK